MGLSWGWVVQGERRMLEYVGELWRSKLGDAVTRRERDTLACLPGPAQHGGGGRRLVARPTVDMPLVSLAAARNVLLAAAVGRAAGLRPSAGYSRRGGALVTPRLLMCRELCHSGSGYPKGGKASCITELCRSSYSRA